MFFLYIDIFLIIHMFFLYILYILIYNNYNIFVICLYIFTQEIFSLHLMVFLFLKKYVNLTHNCKFQFLQILIAV